MELYIILLSLVLLASIFSSRFANKTGVPTLLIFICLGLMFGVEGIFRIPFDNYEFVMHWSSLALVFIIFYGGFNTNIGAAKLVMKPAILLSSLGVVSTATILGILLHFVLDWSWLNSFLIASVLSSTDAATIFAILKQKRLNLKYKSASLLEIESGSNDPIAYMLTIILIELNYVGSFDIFFVIKMLLAQVILGCLAGYTTAKLTSWLLKKYQNLAEGFDTIFVVAMVLFAYSAPSLVYGNGYISVYLLGIILGNTRFQRKRYLSISLTGLQLLCRLPCFLS